MNQQSSLLDVILLPLNHGHALNRHWELQTCFYRAAASVQSCWIWRVSLRSLSHASSSRPGFAIERQRSERNPAFFSSRSMRVQRVAPNYFFTSSLQKLSAMKPPYLQGYNLMLRSLGDVSRRTQAMSFPYVSDRRMPAELPGSVEPHGQVRDDKVCGTLCVSICERISSAIAFTASTRAAQ